MGGRCPTPPSNRCPPVLIAHVAAYESLALDAAPRRRARASAHRAGSSARTVPRRALRCPRRRRRHSKTDVTVIAADGMVLGAARGGGFQPQSSASIRPSTLRRRWHRGTPAEHVCACLADTDLPLDERRLAQVVQERGLGGDRRGAQRHLRDPAGPGGRAAMRRAGSPWCAARGSTAGACCRTAVPWASPDIGRISGYRAGAATSRCERSGTRRAPRTAAADPRSRCRSCPRTRPVLHVRGTAGRGGAGAAGRRRPRRAPAAVGRPDRRTPRGQGPGGVARRGDRAASAGRRAARPRPAGRAPRGAPAARRPLRAAPRGRARAPAA